MADKKHFPNTDNTPPSICSKTKILFPFMLFVSLWKQGKKSSVYVTIVKGSFSKITVPFHQDKKPIKSVCAQTQTKTREKHLKGSHPTTLCANPLEEGMTYTHSEWFTSSHVTNLSTFVYIHLGSQTSSLILCLTLRVFVIQLWFMRKAATEPTRTTNERQAGMGHGLLGELEQGGLPPAWSP